MEDWNAIAADCVVISCCCQCLILQLILFILLKLPRKLLAYIKKKVWYRKKEEKESAESGKGYKFQDSYFELQEGSLSVQVEGEELHGSSHDCMVEVEKVLEEFSQKGEFGFGSFWGRNGSASSSSSSSSSSSTCNLKEFDPSLVQFELVEIISTTNSLSNSD